MNEIKNNSRGSISVIIPTFNRAWCIADAVESVLSQNYQCQNHRGNMEVIVVDDGSTDNTRKVLEPFMDQIKFLRQENMGVSAARNCGIKNSCGEFVAFLDSDDLWMPEKLSCQMGFFNSHPKAMICQTEEIWIRKGKRVNPGLKHKKLSGMIFEASLHLCLVSPSAVMMRRKFFDIKGMFDENLPACEDYDMWLRTAIDMPIYLVDTPCIIKNGGHDDQLSAAHSLDKYRISAIVKLLKEKDCKNESDCNGSGRNEPDRNESCSRLTGEQRNAAVRVLHKKCKVYSQGCLKRGKREESEYYRQLIHDY